MRQEVDVHDDGPEGVVSVATGQTGRFGELAFSDDFIIRIPKQSKNKHITQLLKALLGFGLSVQIGVIRGEVNGALFNAL